MVLSVIVKVDGRGRLLIPRDIRRRAGIEENGFVKLSVEEGRLVVEPLGSIASKYYRAFTVDRWPNDLDSFLAEAVRGWLRREAT